MLAMAACDRKDAASAAPAAAHVAHAVLPSATTERAGLRAAYDFVANRVHAFVHHQGRLVISPGELEFLKFIDGGWKTSWVLGQKVDGRAVAYVSGLSALFFVPIDTDGDGSIGQALADVRLRLAMRATVPNQKVSLFANEKPVATIDVDTDWKTYEVIVPAAAIVSGENRFRLTFRAAGAIAGGKRSAAAIERIELGPSTQPASPLIEAPLRAEDVDLAGLRRRGFALPGPSRLSYYVQVPSGAKLAVSHATHQPGATAVIRVARDGARPTTLFEGAAPVGRFSDGLWDLSAFERQVVRLDLVSRAGGVLWGAPMLMTQVPPAKSAPAKRKFERIFIWMVDTLRADKVRVYNPKSVVETPHYDAFARDATRFAWAHVPGTWSLPSHASILTGVYPTVHKATAHEARLSRDVPFAAELLRKAGYRTAIFSSNGYVSGKWGFDRGWDHSRNFIRESLPNGADYLWKTAKEWIKANVGRPQFLYLATVEPHVIYNPKKEFLQRYWDKPYKGPIKPNMTGIQLGQIKSGKLKINETDKAYLEALHNAEITQSDTAFGAFLADLKAQGIYDSSAVIVVSDHGDEFWEHGDVGHAQSVHQELVHIPLIIRAPGVFAAGNVVEADVEAMDLFPTMLELGGIAAPEGTQGSSLVSLAHDEPAWSPRAALSQNLGVSRGVKVGRYRFIHGGLARMELYDEVEDPLEQQNLLGRRAIGLRHLRNVFGLLVGLESRWDKQRWGTAANVLETFYRHAEHDRGALRAER